MHPFLKALSIVLPFVTTILVCCISVKSWSQRWLYWLFDGLLYTLDLKSSEVSLSIGKCNSIAANMAQSRSAKHMLPLPFNCSGFSALEE